MLQYCYLYQSLQCLSGMVFCVRVCSTRHAPESENAPRKETPVGGAQTKDQNTRQIHKGGISESVISRMSGPRPETT